MLFENTPDEYICPISLEIMEDPVIAMDGHSYDRSHIEKWLSKSIISPKTGLELPNKQLIPNENLKRLIKDFVESQSQMAEKVIAPLSLQISIEQESTAQLSFNSGVVPRTTVASVDSLQMEQSRFFSSSAIRQPVFIEFPLPEMLRMKPNCKELLTKAAKEAYAVKNPQAQVLVMRDSLFRQFWIDLVVKSFPYIFCLPNCFISYQQYSNYGVKTVTGPLVEKCLEDLRCCSTLSVMNETRLSNSLVTRLDQAVLKLRNADQLICIVGEHDKDNHYFQTELQHVLIASANKKVIPVTVDADVTHCFPPSMQQTQALSYRTEFNEYQYSQFFADLLCQLGLLDESLKESFNQLGTALKEKITGEFGEPELLQAAINYQEEVRAQREAILSRRFDLRW